ncbi:hypothetical protein K1719_046654 [Acacia pycnantha]|nr:hypothetical protein K1719_046654 [Acacia pycnantha]
MKTRVLDRKSGADDARALDAYIISLCEASERLISDTITKWIHIPPRIPKYFFKVGQVIGSELFVHNEDKKMVLLSVSQGSSISLNLCLQLKNLSADLRVVPTKLYCILYCPVSCQVAEDDDSMEDEGTQGYSLGIRR